MKTEFSKLNDKQHLAYILDIFDAYAQPTSISRKQQQKLVAKAMSISTLIKSARN